jgi:RimJ/RimL family protein N-acetyltransferase
MSAAGHHAAPTLQTPRLVLRAHRTNDFADLSTMWADHVVVRHITGRPSTQEESWSRLLRYAGLWPLLGFGYWAVEERATGRFVGDVGLADFHRDLTPPLGDAPESGWVLASWAHGQGYATEALRAVLAWSDAELAGRSTACLIDPENTASIRVAIKCGYVERGRVDFKGSPSLVLRR